MTLHATRTPTARPTPDPRVVEEDEATDAGTPRYEVEVHGRADRPGGNPAGDHGEVGGARGDPSDSDVEDVEQGSSSSSSKETTPRHRTVIQLDRFQYTRVRIMYRCSIYRRTGCRGSVAFELQLGNYVNFVPHSCRDNVIVPRPITDVMRQLELKIDRVALTFQGRTARRSEHGVLPAKPKHCNPRFDARPSPGRVHRVRRARFGGTFTGLLKSLA